MKRRVIFYILLLFFIAVFIISAIQIFRIQSEYSKGVKEYDNLFNQAIILDSDKVEAITSETEAPSTILGFSIDYDELYSINNDYIGWIYIPDTVINYPLVSSSDNDYYLHRTFLKEYNFAGTLFLDYLTKDLSHSNVIIYGHRMNNGSMFADLEKYLKDTFYEEHNKIYIFTKHELFEFEIISCRVVGLEDECYTVGFSDTSAFNSWAARMKDQSRYTTSHALKDNANIITLSTCVRNNEDSRIVVQAQLVERYLLD